MVLLVWKAYPNKKIAKALGISVKTETHRANAMKNLGATNMVQLIRAALKEN